MADTPRVDTPAMNDKVRAIHGLAPLSSTMPSDTYGHDDKDIRESASLMAEKEFPPTLQKWLAPKLTRMLDRIATLEAATLAPRTPSDDAVREAVNAIEGKGTGFVLGEDEEDNFSLAELCGELLACAIDGETENDPRKLAIAIGKRIATITNALTAALQEAADLREWKRSALEVEAAWDVQEVGKLIGARLGTPIREQILPALTALLAERDAEAGKVARLEAALDAAQLVAGQLNSINMAFGDDENGSKPASKSMRLSFRHRAAEVLTAYSAARDAALAPQPTRKEADAL